MTDLKRLYHDLVRFETELWAAVDARLRRDCDLQLTWFEILQLLDRRPGLRVQDIATEFVITVGGTSKVVDRIEKAGYCRRKPNPHDRRSSSPARERRSWATRCRCSRTSSSGASVRFSAALSWTAWPPD